MTPSLAGSPQTVGDDLATRTASHWSMILLAMVAVMAVLKLYVRLYIGREPVKS